VHAIAGSQCGENVERGGSIECCRLDVGEIADAATLRSVCESSGYEVLEHD
jgi:hypothetical protein